MAGLWAVHQVLTESVINIAGRADLIAAAAVPAGLLLYLKSTESVGWRRVAWLAGLMAATVIGVFAKESAVVISALMALYEFAFWRERKQARGLLLGCTGNPAFACRHADPARQSAGGLASRSHPNCRQPDWWDGRVTATKVMARDFWLAIWPLGLRDNCAVQVGNERES
jgi:protein O-mannosyl-transferase